jgi:cell division protein FtsB
MADLRRSRKPAVKAKPRPKRLRPVRGRRRAIVWAAVASVVLIGLLFAFVYPTRTLLDQRTDTKNARVQLELLRSENAKLAREAKQLKSDAEIERRAREYGMVKPGEHPFVIIPTPTTVAPSTAPPEQPAP